MTCCAQHGPTYGGRVVLCGAGVPCSLDGHNGHLFRLTLRAATATSNLAVAALPFERNR